MAGYEIFFKESVWKDLEAIPKKDLKRILSRIKDLGDDPRPIGNEKLTGHELYRVRQGNYRNLFSIQDNELTIWIIKVGHRKEVYRDVLVEGARQCHRSVGDSEAQNGEG